MLAIIGGSSLAKLPILEVTHRQVVRTPYGDPSCALTFGRIGMQHVVFMARHGYGNSIAPHEINYRANIWALHSVGVKGVIAIGTVGGIRPDMVPGSLVIPDNIVDYSWGRKHTFFEGVEKPVIHVDFTHPYDRGLREHLLMAGRQAGLDVLDGAVYACTQGPRLESAAEIVRLERDGADLVGMTGMPEAALACEMKLPYAHLCMVVNWAAGKGNSVTHVTLDCDVVATSVSGVATVLKQLVKA